MAIAAVLALVCVAAPAVAATAPATGLPDGRGWGAVSPPAKNGDDVIAETSRTRAAAGAAPGLPTAVAFASLGGFADVQGMGIATEYVAQRTAQAGTSGWSTHAITPPQDPLSLTAAAQGLDPLYEGDMSADLARGIFRAWSPLTAAPNVAGVENLYAREDLRSPGAGAYRLLTGAAAPLGPLASGAQRPHLAGASDDLEHVIFESKLALTPDAAPGNTMLYKADHGVVRLLAPAPGCPGTLSPAAPCAIAGAGTTALRQTAHAISADGSRVELAYPVSISANVNTSTAHPSGLYQLDDRGTPSTADDAFTQVDASEKATPDPPRAARFEDASADGERVFFTSGAQLTDTPGAGLYLWRRTPDGDGHHLTLIGGGGAIVLGASGDGRRVYFAAFGQLLTGGPAVAEDGLYLWQDDGTPAGALSFAGAISFGDADANAGALPWNQTPGVARVSPDGGTLLFEVSDGGGLAPGVVHGSCPAGNPDGTSTGRCSALYVYRAASSTPLQPDVVCASCDPSGGPVTANALVNVRAGAGATQVTWHQSRALSADGRRVFFSTAQALVPGDVNGRADAYEYDVPSGTVHLLSSGRSDADSWFLDASASGDDAFFLTRERLVGWDVDSAYDLYDARVGGGFPDPPAAPAPCAGDACRGPAHATPPVVSLASAAFSGDAGRRARARAKARARRRAARRRAKRRCRRGFVKRRVHGRRRCVKRRHHRHRARRRRR